MNILLLALAVELGDVDRFPPAPVINARLHHLVDHRYYLRLQLAQQPRRAEYWRERLDRNAALLAAWEALYDARALAVEERGADDDPEGQRRALERLRGLIGERAYAAGEMPGE